MLKGIWTWYLLPLMPGLVVLLSGRILSNPASAARVGAFALFRALLFLGIAKLNAMAVREILREMDLLDRAGGGS